MTLRLAISGFGRIGRMTLRAFQEMQRNDMEVVLINSPGPVETSAHLYEFDSVHGRATGEVSYGDDWVGIGTGKIHMTRERDPANIPHAKHKVDIVLECSGKFNNRDASAAHLTAGAKKVLVSAPCKNADQTIVYGVNHNDLTADANVISNASCTTNCLAPIAKVLADNVGIEAGYMTTIHAYTGDQPTLDSSHKDLRRARAAAISMIPTSTGATRAVGEVLPKLQGLMSGSAIRVPTANVSVVDLTVKLEKDTSYEEIKQVMKKHADSDMKNILGYTEEGVVSQDFVGDVRTSIFDAGAGMELNSRFFKIISWYDNECGYSNKLIDLAKHINQL